MKFLIIATLVALSAAKPQGYGRDLDSNEVIAILRDDRVSPAGGAYSFDFETANGIRRSESGAPLQHVEYQPTGQQGSYSFTFPNGELFELEFVADENGFQPQSAWLPVAPAFPHPIPQFVLDQIEKARREDEDDSRSGRGNRYDDSDEK